MYRQQNDITNINTPYMTKAYRAIVSRELSKLNAKIDILIVQGKPYANLAKEHARIRQLLAA